MVLANLEECFRAAILIKNSRRLHSQSHRSQGMLDFTMFLEPENLIQKYKKRKPVKKN